MLNKRNDLTRKRLPVIVTMLLSALLLSGCQGPTARPRPEEGVIAVPPSPTAPAATVAAAPSSALTPAPGSVSAPGAGVPVYRDPSQPIEARVTDLMARMTVAEKIGQMTQVERNSLSPSDVASFFIGSVLSGGDSLGANQPEEWRNLAEGFEKAALDTRLGIPLIFGIDAVHGNAHVAGAVVFPHNIGLGAANDADLAARIGRVTAEEMAAVDIRWNFAPVVAVPQDTRWGRTYEGYSENTALVGALGSAYVRGLQGDNLADPTSVLATPKHFIGDGGTAFGSSITNYMYPYLLDQGDTRMDESRLRALFFPPYQATLAAGAQSVMVSFSSWNGVKMHANGHLLSDVLKGEVGFKGFLVSDWQAIDQISSDYYVDVVTSINAGLDMIMVPSDYRKFVATLSQAVEQGAVPMTRIDDAVRRILTVKFEMGLFEHPLNDSALLNLIGTDDHRALARQAVRESLVLLKNQNQSLPLAKNVPLIFVAGQAADDIGLQCGGWTITWQGSEGETTQGTTILEGIRQSVAGETHVVYDRFALFNDVQDAQGQPARADVGIVVVGETPYAEGVGDEADPKLSPKDVTLIEKLRGRVKKLVVVLETGRPLEITDQWPLIDALVVAWLPGTEGNGVADVLFGDHPFTGKLPYTWQRWNGQLPFDFRALPTEGCDAPLFPYGFGLSTQSPSPVIPTCTRP
jgi:beta-glucosidase